MESAFLLSSRRSDYTQLRMEHLSDMTVEVQLSPAHLLNPHTLLSSHVQPQ